MIRIAGVPVLAPFPNITVHVVQTPGVGLFLPNRVGMPARVPIIPRILLKISFFGIKAVLQLAAGLAGIFPFRLGGKPVSVRPFQFVELFDEDPHVIPRYVFHGAVFAALAEYGWIFPHDPGPLSLGDLRGLQVKPFGKGHSVQSFVSALEVPS